MNTLEDAFINVGMDEERFLKNNSTIINLENIRNSTLEKQEAKFTTFADIKKPACLS